MYINLVLQLEILLVNLIITGLLATRKYKIKTTVISLILFTFLSVLFYFVLNPDDSSRYYHLIAGFTFIIPLILLYKESVFKMTTIMFFSWTQTMIISNISLSLANIIDAKLIILPIVFHTILLAIAFPLIKIFAQKTYKVIIEGISNDTTKLLMVLATILFSMSIIFGYFISGDIVIIITLLLLEIANISVYTLLRDFINKSKTVISLNKLAFTDSLTKLENRFSLFTNTNQLIEQHIPFHCIYMDLDGLKSVNDTYGHLVGDKYLQYFSSAVIKSISKESKFYRIAGDEFVCITEDVNVNIDELKSKIVQNFNPELNFKGVSIGYSTYKKDGETLDTLLGVADSKMYKRKKVR
ncbi:GGDEF domain-containing protein [Mariniplasma anaerobium]|uniref:GGDEF domain-containing protein n=1 Tax=Mariniplasma anaerobium TaxID=2735436 RepID=A0A7U9TKG1_9MOLU|nr:GGDEF domain-containing protein [Mariniplasma anaerobium]BCR35258.1 GGDEF domain-containing protein [Mariniplasma anaerobium]